MKRLSLQGLQPGKSYSIQVRSVLQGKSSEWSQSLDFTTVVDTNPPENITGLTWDSVGTAWVATWTHIDTSGAVERNNDFDHYDVRITHSSNNVIYTTQNNRFEFPIEANISSFGEPKNPLSVSVRTVDTSGNAGDWISYGNVSNPPPGPPSSINAESGIERISVTWTPPSDSDLAYYRVYTSSSSGGTYTLAASPRTNSYLHETTSTNMVYFRVFSVDVFGTESLTYASASEQARPAAEADSTPPDDPTSVTVTPGFDTTRQQSYVDIAWTNPTATDLNNVNVRYSSDGSNWSYISLPANSGENQSYRLDVVAGSSVYVGVQAQDFTGNKSSFTSATPYPATAVVDTTPPSQPAAPTVVGGVMIAFVSHNGNKQAGGAMEADTARYEVHASSTSGFSPSTSTMLGSINASSVAGSSFPILATKTNTTWYFKVVAVDRSGNRSTASNQTTETIAVIEDNNIDQEIIDSINDALNNSSDALDAASAAIKNVVTEYAVNSSETVPPTSGWSTSTPTRTPGTFIWYRATITYGDDSTSTSSPALLTGNTGEQGSDGADGRGITSTQIGYQSHTSPTTTPTGTWLSTPPTVSENNYLWTRTVITYTDSTTSISYSVAKQGAQGPQGIPGSPGSDGSDGATLYTWLKYADSPTSGMSDSPTGKTYIGLAYNKTTPTESSNYGDYSWSLIKGADGQDGADGNQGPPGDDGQTTYTWVKYANNASGSGMSDSPTGKPYIGFAFNKTTPTESTTAGDYTWSLIQGADGADGADGSDGDDGVSVISVTPYFRTTTQGASAPAKPTTMTPASPWSATEPDYAANTDLWRTDRIVFSNSTFSYTTVTKVSAYTAATTAITAANGKNNIYKSTATPSGSGYINGDTWYRFNTSGELIGWWIYASGAWVSQTITDAVVSNLNAASITAGTLSADRIGSNSISTKKLILGDQNNYASNFGFEDAALRAAYPLQSTQEYYQGTESYTGEGYSIKITPSTSARISPISEEFPVFNGDKFYISWLQKRSGTVDYDAFPCLRVLNSAGTPVHYALQPVTPSRTMPDNTWTFFEGIVTVTASDSIKGLITIRTTSAGTTGDWYIDNVTVRRAEQGSMIVDGSITATQIGTNEIIANTANIKNAVITGAKLANATITDAKIANATITDAKIKSLKADKIEAGSAFVTDITLKDGVDPITGLASTGKIKSDNFNDVAKTGMQLDKTGLKIYDGYIAAKAVELKSSFNLMPAPMASFESIRRYYEDNIATTNCTVDIVPESVVGEQSLEIVSTGTWTADLGTDQNIAVEPGKDYILSLSAKGDSGGENLKVRLQYDTGASTESISETLTTSFNRYHAIFTAPSGVTDCVVQLFGTSAVTVVVDAIQLEEKFGLLDTPSRWQPPSSTTIDGGQIRTGFIEADRIETGTITGDKLVAGFVAALEIEAQQIVAGDFESDLGLLGKLLVGGYVEIDGETSSITIYSDLEHTTPLVQLRPEGSVFRGQVIADDISVLNGLVLLGIAQLETDGEFILKAGAPNPEMGPTLSLVTESADWPEVPSNYMEKGITYIGSNQWVRLLVPTTSVPGNCKVEVVQGNSVITGVFLADVPGVGEDDMRGIAYHAAAGSFYTAVHNSTGWRVARFDADTGAYENVGPVMFADSASQSTVGMTSYPVGGGDGILQARVYQDKLTVRIMDDNPNTHQDIDLGTMPANWSRYLYAVRIDDFDFGSPHLMVVTGATARMWSLTGSPGSYVATPEYDKTFDLGASVGYGGADWDSDADLFKAVVSGQKMRVYSKWKYTNEDTVHVAYADSDGTHHTAASPIASITRGAERRYVQVTLPALTDGATQSDVYAAYDNDPVVLSDLGFISTEVSRIFVFDPATWWAVPPEPPTTNTFTAGASAVFRSENSDLVLRGDGTIDVPEPTQPEHAASKAYVDAHAGGPFGLWRTESDQSVSTGSKAVLGNFYPDLASQSADIDSYIQLNTGGGRDIWTILQDGTYRIVMKVKWNASSSGHRYIYPRIDNVEVDNISAAPGNGALLTLVYEFPMLGLEAGQDIRLQTMQNSGGTRQIVGSSTGYDTSVTFQRIGDLAV